MKKVFFIIQLLCLVTFTQAQTRQITGRVTDDTGAPLSGDSAIYRVPTNNNVQWGHRVFYYQCRKEGGKDFTWYRDNLPASLKPQDITVKWVFGNRWNPLID